MAGYILQPERKRHQTLIIVEVYPGKVACIDPNSSLERKDLEKNVEFSPESW